MVARLREAFLEKFRGVEPHWGALGWFTYKRTYARENKLEGRTEDWSETIQRVVEGNVNMIPGDPLVDDAYMEKMYRQIFHLIWTPPGRGLWMSGSEFAKRSGDAMNNCWFVQTRPYRYGATSRIFTRYAIDPDASYPSYPFVFTFDQLMKGGGVGFSVENALLERMPVVQNKATLSFHISETHPTYPEIRELAHTYGFALNRSGEEADVHLVIADSREGWCESLAVAIDRHYTGSPQHLSFDLNELRPRDAEIKGFGGKASGSAPLVELLLFVNDMLNKRTGRRLTSKDCTDIYNMIGRTVIAGNVRRSAEVALGDAADESFIHMKNWRLTEHLWTYEGGERRLKTVEEVMAEHAVTAEEAEELLYDAWAQNNHRWSSNNSVIIDDPSGYDFGLIAPAIEVNGEPGIYNRWLARNFGRIIDGYRANCDPADGGNPCMEISLASYEPCNLVELHLPKMLEHRLDPADVLPMMVQYAKRITFAQYDWESTREIVQKNRRIGISLSGIQDWIVIKWGRSAIVGWELYHEEEWDDMQWLNRTRTPYAVVEELPANYEGYAEPIYHPEIVDELNRMYAIVKKADEEYSALLSQVLGMEVRPSIKLTTVKPSGSVSLLSGITPGIHWSYFEYGIRRIMCQKGDFLVDLAKDCGYRVEDSVYTPNSVVIEFPYKASSAGLPGFKSCAEITIEEQFAMQALFNIYWADNMVSCTISFHEHERSKIAKLLKQYRMRIKSTSLLPYSGHGYQQAPYEPTTQEEYEARLADIKMPIEQYYRRLREMRKIQDTEMTLAEAAECVGGACPIR
ncbi:ribonucleoside-triphosphate reductase, adenosylcobalamin-dependent [Brevibacillus sp. SYP-B805]|uniref:ribonucleoside-triphosphate reductase, adenosylcobalamin-dependent n=1 Tax=Brevibacillus sp. SYP-B805 TaxID=1578199 RepID=UPI0013EBE9FB|nr:ribonucleoside-triphosphate reductase, adenosylcobalamin-dependent [Brevibacillus sp. SYP-B805]NGQ94488.1 ribonucleoside-triphosphate reductase, adenosylcobalamin-dependent [Brevibacillus sp. SYP-B805]